MSHSEPRQRKDPPGSRSAAIPLTEPSIGGNAWRYVKECLDSGWVSSAGPMVTRFETSVAQYTGSAYAVATSSGTAALHLALLAAGVQEDDEVLVPALTFIATANAVRYCHAHPVFIDVEPAHWQMDLTLVEAFLANQAVRRDGSLRNRATGRRIRAILPVDLLGHPANWNGFCSLAGRYGIKLVADASESLGATYEDRRSGSLADISCLSFNGNKIITTGGGGMVLTDNEEWAGRVRYLSTQAKDDPIEYVHGEVGFNYRLTNLQAALGVAQMEDLDKFVDAKRAIASRYDRDLSRVPGVLLPAEADGVRSTFWLYTIRINKAEYGTDSRSVMRLLEDERMQTRPMWEPLPLSKPYRGMQSTPIPVASAIYQEALSLPCSINIDPRAQEAVAAAIARGATLQRVAGTCQVGR